MEEFKPRPGGLVDSIRRDVRDTEEVVHDIPETVVDDQGYKALRVQPESPDVFGARTITLATKQTAICLGHDVNRARATIQVVTTSGSVILASTQGNADSGVGYTLTQAMNPLVVTARGILYVNNPGGSSCQVSVLSELYTD